ncbi:MAG TPA: response regulator, partial [Solirubrobacteraceae bacterium]|nr:response regulator [Solirubrobacteraceae bacterium]
GPALRTPAAVADDRGLGEAGDRVLLVVIENDPQMAAAVRDAARARGLMPIVAERGEAVLALAQEFQPDGVVMSLELSDGDGLAVLERLKHHPHTRHIPVYAFSSKDQRHAALRAGVVAYSETPAAEVLEEGLEALESFIERRVRNLLVVEDDATERSAIVELIGDDGDVAITAVASSEEALQALEDERFDCMVVDLKLPSMTGFALLEQIKGEARYRDMPVIVHTGTELTRKEETRLRKYAESIIVKDANSPERLLDETTLFLHRPQSSLPPSKRRMLEQLHSADAVLQGKKVLVVDDDVRNGFALASAFEARGMQVLFAESGLECIDVLNQTPDVAIVLMDVMMPDMDGHETTRAIRAMPACGRLPIITLTAKAMKEDREKSVESGASDYITKPVDIEQLLSLMRVWMYE